MKILVLVKQIPEISKITFDKNTGRINREGVPLIMNSFDKRAVEEAIRIKEKDGSAVMVASMGPPQAADVLDEALRMGADRAFLVSDRKFGGSDTWATSAILSSLIKKIKPDLVLAGKYSLDGETSQVPPQIAQMIGFNFVSGASKIEFMEKSVRIEQDYESGIRTVETTLPLLISVSEKINRARKIDENLPSMKEKIELETAESIPSKISGIENSLTVVDGTEIISMEKVAEMVTMDRAFELIKDHLNAPSEDLSVKKVEMKGETKNGMVLGISLDDPSTSLQIASKIHEIASGSGKETLMVGNVNPEMLRGMTANKYIHLKGGDVYAIADFISDIIINRKPEFVVFPSNSTGRDVAGYVSAKLSLGLTADCIDLVWKDGKLVQYKPAFGGGVVARILSKTKPEMTTVRPGIFKIKRTDSPFELEEKELKNSDRVKLISDDHVESKFIPLQSAKIILCIGRGVKGKSTVDHIVELAQKLGIAVAGTRPVVDMRLLPRQQQIGITGLSVSPDLYIGIGVSGMDNHVMGIRYAKTVIGINNDPEAPIFHHADYGVLGNAEDFVEHLSNLVNDKDLH